MSRESRAKKAKEAGKETKERQDLQDWMRLVPLDLMDCPSPAVAGELDLSLDLTLTSLLEVIRTITAGTTIIKVDVDNI